MYVYSLVYPACNAHVSYYHLWPARLYKVFPHYLINATVFGKRLRNTKCVFWFSLQFLSKPFLILRRTERDMNINVYRSSCEVPVIVVGIYWYLKFLDWFERNSQWLKFENPSIRGRDVPCGLRDRQKGMTKVKVIFGSFANAHKTQSVNII